jgi:Fe-S cluster biogenesis protein NfuA
MSVDHNAVAARVKHLDQLIRAHAGGLELEEVTADGIVRLRFTGMCAACEYRPVTVVGSVRPALMAIDGVRGVEIAGGRISAEAEARIAEDLAPYAPELNVGRAVGMLEKLTATAEQG